MIHIISPHIDDAVLSIGGLIEILVSRGEKVKIQYVFTRTNWVNSMALQWQDYKSLDIDFVTKLRKEEERYVAKVLGHDYGFFDFYDFPIRNSDDISNQENLIQRITTVLTESIPISDDIIFPFGQKHPDHKLIGYVAKCFLNLGYNVFYYEDLPYVARHQHDYQETFYNMKERGYSPQSFEIDVTLKTNVLKCYKSQMSNEWLDTMKSYSYNSLNNSFYERIWLPNKSILIQNFSKQR